MRLIENIKYGNDNPAQLIDLYLPDNVIDGETPVFVYFHGGGIENGSRKNMEVLCEYLTAHGIAVASADYIMYPEAKYPEFIEDSALAVAWAKKNLCDGGEYGNFGKLYIGGSSAGGYLSMMLCFDGKYLGKYGIAPASVGGYVHDAGQPTAHFNVLKYRGIDSRRIIVDESAPLFHFGTAKELAPMIFIASDGDMENRYEQTMLVMSTLKHFRYDESKIRLKVMHGGHCHYVHQKDENDESVFGKICEEFFNEFK
ncbi:MAG: alpha/beta hydrolase [Clostridia bacterium]|nr:alpha/beta hydrolase [Clostridia bacterium]